MIDALVVSWRDEWRCADQSAISLIDGLVDGVTLIGSRVTPGCAWVRDGDAVKLRAGCTANQLMNTANARFSQPLDQQGVLHVTGQLAINPTRFLARLGGQSIDEWFSAFPIVAPGPRRQPHDNMLPADMLAAPRLDFYWCDAAARLADHALSLIMSAVFGDRSRRPRTSLRSVECYWEFGSDDPLAAIHRVAPAIQGASEADSDWYRERDEVGTRKLEFAVRYDRSVCVATYARDARVRVEVRYNKRVCSGAPGAGRGSLRDRLHAVADKSAEHVNKVLNSTRMYRAENILVGSGAPVTLLRILSGIFGPDVQKVDLIATQLFEQGYVRAGAGPYCCMTLNEAAKLQREGAQIAPSLACYQILTFEAVFLPTNLPINRRRCSR